MPTSERPAGEVVRLVAGAAALLAAAGATYVALLYLGLTDPRELAAANRVKIARLRATASPKVIVVGGSNALFGVDSAELARALGVPVVNASMAAAVSLDYYRHTVTAAVGPGDVVVAAFEHVFFYRDPVEVTDATLEVLIHDPDPLGYLRSLPGGVPWRRLGGLLGSNSKVIGWIDNRLRPLVRGLPPRIYQSASLDGHGDMVAHLGLPASGVVPSREPAAGGGVSTAAIEAVRRFDREVRERGGSIVFSWPSVTRSQYAVNRDLIEAVASAFAAAGLDAHATPADYVFPDELAYDTAWHLNAAGRQQRTLRMLAELRAHRAHGETR